MAADPFHGALRYIGAALSSSALPCRVLPDRFVSRRALAARRCTAHCTALHGPYVSVWCVSDGVSDGV